MDINDVITDIGYAVKDVLNDRVIRTDNVMIKIKAVVLPVFAKQQNIIDRNHRVITEYESLVGELEYKIEELEKEALERVQEDCRQGIIELFNSAGGTGGKAVGL